MASFYREENDFPLYNEAAYSPGFYAMNNMQNFVDSPNYPRPQDFPAVSTYTAGPLYAEISQTFHTENSPHQYPVNSPELRPPPSNLSTASASSSTIGSPYSTHGHAVPVPEWSSNPLGINPEIVGLDSFAQEYNYSHSGMEQPDYSYTDSFKPGFVGECSNIPESTRREQRFLSSSSTSTFALQNDFSHSMSEASTQSPLSAITPVSNSYSFKSPPTPALSSSPLSTRRFSVFSNTSRGPDLKSSATVHTPRKFSQEQFPQPVYHQTPFFSQTSGQFVAPLSYPSILHPYGAPVSTPGQHIESVETQPYSMYPPPQSPTPSSPSSRLIKRSQSPYANNYSHYPYPARRLSLASHHSYNSADGSFDSDETHQKGRCPNPECGKVFKDLKAHMLTHQNERPEKCPIQTCDYHVKGFARKYDKNRHTLTHYKGTMVCGFCPGSGSAAEKSFNRADVFKRHLTSVHAVEQAAPNSRKKISGNGNTGKKLSGYAPDATGKCSTCSQMFANAQEFYEHLDDCVLRIVQQEEPSERINAERLAEVENDKDVHETLRNNGLPIQTINYNGGSEDEEDGEGDDENDLDYGARSSKRSKRVSPNGAVRKVGLTLSKGGVTLHSKGGRKKRKELPTSWGMQSAQMKMKKRVMCAFDGQRRLWKDDMMLSTDYEVRLPLGDGKHYVTDLDVQTLKRAEAFHGASEEEKGEEEMENEVDLEALMGIKGEE